MKPRPLELYHGCTRRRRGCLVYWPARWILKSFMLIYFRERRLRHEHIPKGR